MGSGDQSPTLVPMYAIISIISGLPYYSITDLLFDFRRFLRVGRSKIGSVNLSLTHFRYYKF